MPITPKAMRPPITPAKISSRGKSAPRLMRRGRRTLSRVTTISVQMRRTLPQKVSPLQNSQMTAGIKTGAGPS